ncbi:MAG: LamG domain-containing protein [Fibrobacteria bacterium]|nr:LamG domain-containing protein [Fibrobacteria bacterium]
MVVLGKILIMGLFLTLGFAYSENIILVGKVVDKQAKPLKGVVMALSGAGLSDTTDADGKFKISDYKTTGTNFVKKRPQVKIPEIQNGNVFFTVQSPLLVSIDLIALDGRQLSHINKGMLQQGNHQFPIAFRGLQQGLYIVRAQIGKKLYTSKYVHTGEYVVGSRAFTPEANTALAKAAAIVDTLSASINDSVYATLEIDNYVQVLDDIVLDVDTTPKSEPVAFEADSSTIALWHFDEGEGSDFKNEISGKGELAGGPEWVDGKFGKALYFDGLDDYGQCNFNPPERNFTVEVWYKPENPPDNFGFILLIGGSNYDGFRLNGNEFDMKIYKDVNGRDNTFLLPETEWVYIALTINEDHTAGILYFNGEKAGELYCIKTPVWKEVWLATDATKTKLLKGTIDELRISNTQRTAEEIKEHWQQAGE